MTSDPAKCDPSLPGGEDVFKQGVEVLKGAGTGTAEEVQGGSAIGKQEDSASGGGE